MSQIKEYMQALAKERREKGELDARNIELSIIIHERLEQIAEKLGIDTSDENWWDVSQEQQFKIIMRAINELKEFGSKEAVKELEAVLEDK